MAAYATLKELRSRLGYLDADTADDATLVAVLEAVTQTINALTHRRFQPYTATRYYTPRSAKYADVDDLLSITTLATDDTDDQTWSTVWSAGDYRLRPFNASSEDPRQPYTQLEAINSVRSFPLRVNAGLKISGTFGFYDYRSTSSSTVSGAHNATTTDIATTSGTPFSVGQTLLIGSERLYITAIAGHHLTVRRGENGTTAAAIAGGAAIEVYSYPVVTEACLIQAIRLFKRRDAPYGVAGNAEIGQFQVIPRLDPDVKMMLEPFKRLTVA